ncbi:TIGR04197 family type VII secretion effector [Enterococcus sp. BWM-S5]|uniref:TIGR04197 family type VII secretion effector n=1 Tax=Enterococcus larvae TaxID=2794352 RepID=A0ABS4CKK1_9ENTE|nr:TIGR04197 family type VII secretion effector [Enterococcus larvae]MBP1047148.1 TIGR04197 family type VII secretion effector [Enterococcus larvae]
MVKNSVTKANTIASKISSGSSMSFEVDASVSYSSSSAVSGLTECLSSLSGLVQGFSSNVTTDSGNIRMIASAYKKADSDAGKGFSDD